MKKLFMAVLVLVLAGCGGGGGSSPAGSLEVSGNIYNTAPAAAAVSAAALAGAAEKLPDVSKGKEIMVSTAVANNTAAPAAALSFSIEIEDASFSTPANWQCQKKYNGLDGGTYGFEVWTVYAEPLPACTGEPKDTAFVCETYPARLDCLTPYWAVEYAPPGDGLWKASGSLPGALAPGDTWAAQIGYGNSGIDIRPGHKARWVVKDDKGNTVASKDYIFTVTP